MTTPPPHGQWPTSGSRPGWPAPMPVAPPPMAAPLGAAGPHHNRWTPQSPPATQQMPHSGRPISGFAPPPRAVMPPPMAALPGPPRPGWSSNAAPMHPTWAMGYQPIKKKSAGPVIAVVLVAAMVIGIGVTALIVGNQRKSAVAEPGYNYSGYTSTTTTTSSYWTTTYATYSTTSTTTTTSVPTTSLTTDSATPYPPPRTQQYTPRQTTVVPPQPRPVNRLGDNPVHYAARPVAPANCQLPAFNSNLNTLRAFYSAGVRCMHEAWTPVMRAANLPADAPGIEITAGPSSSPCGSGSSGAFYCPQNRTIYVNVQYKNENLGTSAAAAFGVLAHEYGHHVQGRSGILDASWKFQYEAGTNSARGLELSRRLELQASCFAGMFLASSAGRASVSRNFANAALTDLGGRGDWPNNKRPRDHGSPANNKAWSAHGYRYNNSKDCNTWMAPTNLVS